MEERIIDKDDGRLVRIKKTAEGETDAVEDTGEEDAVFELPEGDEYDEDLVGLTPSQLKEELERRERLAREARERSARLTEEGDELLQRGEFGEAEEKFRDACFLDRENEHAEEGRWLSATKNFTDLSALYEEENYIAVSESEHARGFVLAHAGEELKIAREEYRREEEELSPAVEGALEERRSAFAVNRKYYMVRFFGFLAAFAACLVAVAASAANIYTTRSPAPVICAAAFGGAAFVMLVFLLVYSRKLLVAHRLCRENEDLSSTADGARLLGFREKLEAIDYLFGEGEGARGESKNGDLTEGKESGIIEETEE